MRVAAAKTHAAWGDKEMGTADQKEAFSFSLEAAVELGGPELTQISEADPNVFTYLGVPGRGAGPGDAVTFDEGEGRSSGGP